MTTPNNPDPELAAELRRLAGDEWTEDAAEDERLTEVLRRRRLGLKDLLKDMAHRGRRVSVDFGGHAFNGGLINVGTDYAGIQGPGQVAEVRLNAGRWSDLPPSEGITTQPVSAPDTFVGALRAHEAAKSLIRLSMPNGDMIIGKIDTVSADHLEFAEADERKIYVPTELILGIVRSIDPH